MNIANTKWLLCTTPSTNTYEITFNADGSFSYKINGISSQIASGHFWTIEGDKISFSFNNRVSEFCGLITGDRIIGTGKNRRFQTWNFEANKIVRFPSSDTSSINTYPSWVDESSKFQICDIKRHPFSGESFKINALSYYYQKNKYPIVPDVINFQRRFVYNFKDGVGNAYEKAAIRMASAIIANFTPLVLNNHNTVCCIIPASTIAKTHNRFYRFCEKISTLLGCTNGYEFIKAIKDSEAAHLGGKVRGDISNISIVDDEINDKTIYLFDDILTSGKTFVALANALKVAGAKEVIGFFLGKTYDSYRLGEPTW
jgi:predicted amidophosphoribosyltransferase